MLILGIETATHAGRLRHRRARRRDRLVRSRRAAGVTPRRSSPAIEFVCAKPASSSTRSAPSPSMSGRGSSRDFESGVAAAKAIASALRVPMIGIPSLDLLAFPVRYTSRTIVAIDRRPAGRALLRVLPAGAGRRAAADAASGRHARRRWRPSSRRPGRTSSWSATAPVATPTAFERPAGVELVEQWLAHPSAALLVQLAHSCALREEFVNPWDLEPVYLRRPDAEINWATRDSR